MPGGRLARSEDRWRRCSPTVPTRTQRRTRCPRPVSPPERRAPPPLIRSVGTRRAQLDIRRRTGAASRSEPQTQVEHVFEAGSILDRCPRTPRRTTRGPSRGVGTTAGFGADTATTRRRRPGWSWTGGASPADGRRGSSGSTTPDSRNGSAKPGSRSPCFVPPRATSTSGTTAPGDSRRGSHTCPPTTTVRRNGDARSDP